MKIILIYIYIYICPGCDDPEMMNTEYCLNYSEYECKLQIWYV